MELDDSLLTIIIVLLVGLGAALKKGINEIIRGLESIDERLARAEVRRSADAAGSASPRR